MIGYVIAVAHAFSNYKNIAIATIINFIFLLLQLLHASGNHEPQDGGNQQPGNVVQRMCRLREEDHRKVKKSVRKIIFKSSNCKF